MFFIFRTENVGEITFCLLYVGGLLVVHVWTRALPWSFFVRFQVRRCDWIQHKEIANRRAPHFRAAAAAAGVLQKEDGILISGKLPGFGWLIS